jgi:predicted ATPase/class 3 adenylate cyclase
MTAVGQPAGTVTFVFTDIEGSTRLLDELGAAGYREALARHRGLVREACGRHRGYEVDYEGDAFFLAFHSPEDAVSAVSDAMAALAEGPIRVRVGIHTGEPVLDPPKYVGMDVHLAARVAASAHGGQVVLSGATRQLLDDRFPLTDLGEHRLKDIAQAVAIYQLGAGAFPPLKTISNTNLPRPASSFVGRERELEEVRSRIEAGARLLTLTGPGGSGKTRLAIEAAAALVPEYRAGVFWVGLATLRDPTLVTEQIAQTLGARDGLAEHIGQRELLLLLDNLEQVIAAAPELGALLASCPHLTLLVTSRELLRVSGEVEYEVPPLAGNEAVALFCERVQTEPSEEIAELCARLDSLPLAVELAAARAKVLSPGQILARLSQRLDLLKGGRDADPRQQTLRATIEWSHDLLSEEEQQLFGVLSAFAGGCTLEAAEEIAGADLDTLQSLVEKSLVRFTAERYWMLETIREYAAERLAETGEGEAWATAHAEHYAAWAEEVAPRLRGPGQAEWLPRVDEEHENLRAAMAWSLEARPEVALRLGAALWRYWWTRSHLREGRAWLERLRPIALTTADEASVRVLSGAGALARDQGDWEFAALVSEEAVEVARSLGDPVQVAGSTHNLAIVLHVSGNDLERARTLFLEALQTRREIGDLVGVAQTLNGLSGVALAEGDIPEARRFVSESLAVARELGDKESTASSLLNLAFLALEEDDAEIDVGWTSAALRESLELMRELGSPIGMCSCLESLAVPERLVGNHDHATRLLAAAARVREEIGAPLQPEEIPFHERTTSSLRAALGRGPYDRAWEEGWELSLEEATRSALDGTG